MGETKRVSKPMKKSSRHHLQQQQQRQPHHQQQQQSSEVAEIHAVPDLISRRRRATAAEHDILDSDEDSDSPDDIEDHIHRHQHHQHQNGSNGEEEEEIIIQPHLPPHHPLHLPHLQQSTLPRTHHSTLASQQHRGSRDLLTTSSTSGRRGDVDEQELLELDFEEDILELHQQHHHVGGYHTSSGHVNSTCSYVPTSSTSSSAFIVESAASSTVVSPCTLSPLQSSTTSTASTARHQQLYSAVSADSCSAYFKLTGSRHSLRDPSTFTTGRKVSDATKEEIQDDEDEASLRELLMR
jgi:hypothetical protein